MFTFSSARRGRFCDGQSRRDFLLRIGALGALSLTDVLRQQARAGGIGKNKAAILIFLAGGPPHIDMWDPKPTAPEEIRGEFASIKTKVPGIIISEMFPQIAASMDKFAIIRSLTGCSGEHSSRQCFSGYDERESERGEYPCVGSVVAKLNSGEPSAVPSFMSICSKSAHRPWGNPGEAGYLGPSFGPFRPEGQGMADMILNGDLATLASRGQLLKALDRFKRENDASGQAAGMDAFQAQSLDLLTSPAVVQALDLSREPKESRERYGYGSLDPVDDGPCPNSQLFLTARRLIEAGVKVVTMNWCRWDWHGANFTQGRLYMPWLDQGLATLVNDLHERGLANDVSVLVWGEFGRTPKVNKDAGRDHWPPANTALLAGGGMRTGQVIGETDRLGQRPVSEPVHMQEVLATIYRQLGVDLETTLADRSGRPRYLLDHRTPVSKLI